MTRAVAAVVLGATFLSLLLPAVARGQRRFGGMPWLEAPTGGVVAGHGTVVVKKAPTAARMHLALSGKGKTIEDALADLKAKREKAVALLEKLGADRKSIEPGSPRVSREDNQRRRQLESMIRQKMRGGKGGKAVKLPETVTVVAVLSAEWPLKTADPEAAFVAVHKLQEQIKAAKLAGAKEERKLSPEEEELAEEMGSEMGSMPGLDDEQGDPNTPVFVYVATIADPERDKAMAEAFQKAKADAARLAQAAGARLGPLAGVGGSDTNGAQTGYAGGYDDFGHGPMRELLMRSMSSMEQELKDQEATGSDPGRVSFVFSVTANFALDKQTERPKPVQEK